MMHLSPPLLGFWLLCLATTRPSIAAEHTMASPGVKQVQVAMASLQPSATFRLGGSPDWMVITGDAVWVSNAQLRAVHRIDPATNKVVAEIHFPAAPCSGLAFGFGSLWVPLCGKPSSLARVDPLSNKITAILHVGPADSEGGIAASEDSIWMATDKRGTLARIDPTTTGARQKISIAPGSYNPLFSDGTIWVTGFESGVLTAVDASTGEVTATVHVGSKPRFLTSGGGSVWTLNQGNGTVSRVDARTKRLVATIEAGIPGHGGEICYGADSVWTTVMDIPLTRIDATTEKVVRQWIGPGGDSVRIGHGSIWLTDLRRGLLWRIPLNHALLP
jgi:virginiamycin B lyase